MQTNFNHIWSRPQVELLEEIHVNSPAILGLILAALLNPSFLSEARAHPLINNDDVRNLSDSCLPEEVVVRAVEYYETDFNTSDEALSTLRQSGVSERVLEAMLSKTSS